MTARAASQHSGFSLLEVLVALSLSAVLLLGLAVGLTGAMRQNVRTRDAKEAATLAAATIERLRAQDPGTLTSGQDPSPVDATGAPGGMFTRSWNVIGGYAGTALTRVDVQVTWSDGSPRQLTYSTLLAP